MVSYLGKRHRHKSIGPNSNSIKVMNFMSRHTIVKFMKQRIKNVGNNQRESMWVGFFHMAGR